MNAWKSLLNVIRKSDIIIEVLDARFPETKSEKLERMVKERGKKLIIVLNKCDLLKNEINTDLLLFSAKTGRGKNKLMRKLKRMGGGKVGVIGYPNVGKSSLINRLAGRKVARTSPRPGFTKGKQYIRADDNLLLLDTPGVIPVRKSKEDLALIGAFDPNDVDPLICFYKLLPKIRSDLEEKFGPLPEDEKETLTKIALELNMLKKGGKPDLRRAATYLIRKWQRGKPF